MSTLRPPSGRRLCLRRGWVRTPLLRTLTVLLGAALLTACAGTPEAAREAPPVENAAIDPFDLQIRIGRLGVMVNQGIEAFRVLYDLPKSESVTAIVRKSPSSNDNATDSTLDVDQRAQMYVRLKSVGDLFLKLKGAVCDDPMPLVDDEACLLSFNAPWTALRGTPTLAQLDSWTDETQAAILPLWGALCEQAVAKTGDDTFCAIE